MNGPTSTAGESGRDDGRLREGVLERDGLLDGAGVEDADFVTPHSVHFIPAERLFLKPQT